MCFSNCSLSLLRAGTKLSPVVHLSSPSNSGDRQEDHLSPGVKGQGQFETIPFKKKKKGRNYISISLISHGIFVFI
jgi:hypothetical protein